MYVILEIGIVKKEKLFQKHSGKTLSYHLLDGKLTANYKGFTEDDIVSEYVFTMRKLDFRKAIDIEFLNYNSEYISTPQ